MKLAAERFQQEYEKQRASAIIEMAQAKSMALKKGGRDSVRIISQAMRKDMAAPLLAVKRPTPGPQGQPAGSLATSPTEVDEIVRTKWAEIYRGNVEDPDHLVDQFLNKYADYLPRASAAHME